MQYLLVEHQEAWIDFLVDNQGAVVGFLDRYFVLANEGEWVDFLVQYFFFRLYHTRVLGDYF